MSSRNYRDFDLLRHMEAEMARIADETIRGFFDTSPNRFWQPRVDVHETPDTVVVKAEISGVKSSTLNVVLSSDDRILSISGERVEQDTERAERVRCFQLEINYGPFERQVALPPDLIFDRDQIRASCRDGFLVVVLPKQFERSHEVRSIPIAD